MDSDRRMLSIFLVCCVVVVGGFLSLFFGYQFLLQVLNYMRWKSIILGYCKYDIPFLFLVCFVIASTVIPRLTKIIRSRITFVSPSLR